MPLVLDRFTEVHLDSVSTRQEHHGESLVPAIDLKMTIQGNNRLMDMLHADLRGGFFTLLPVRDQPEKGNKELDLPVDDLPNLRFPKMKYPLKFENEQVGMHLEVDYGLGGKSNIHLSLCKVKGFEVTPIEGGNIEWKFSVASAADITERIAGVLALQQQHSISIKLLPPKPGSEGAKLAEKHAAKLADDEEGLQDGGDGEGGDGESGSEGSPTAGDLFAAQHGTAAQKRAAKKTAAKKAPAKKAAKKTPAKKAAAKKAKE